MLIGIDGNEANVRERVGVNVWAFELLKQFKRMKDEGRRTKEDNNSFRIYLARLPLPDLPLESTHWQYRVIPDSPLWTRWRLPIDLYVHHPRTDVFLSLSHYAPKWAPMPRIVSIMDLSFLHFPEAFKPLVRWQLEHWTRESIRNAAHVLTISKFTKKEIVATYKYPEDGVTVIYPGVSEKVESFKRLATRERQKATREIKKKYNVGRYILFVGTLQPKKNLPRLIDAFKLIQKDFSDVQLVIAGKIWEQFHYPLSTIHYSRAVRFLGYVPDSDLPPLISGAECLVLPSLYEGFGIPVLEAMVLGTPVAASNTTSIPEVLAGAGVFFDPTDVSDIARGVREVLSWSAAKRQEQVKKGMIRAEKFSWEQGAEKILRLVENVC